MRIADELIKFLKFNVVGLINTAVDFVAYSLLIWLGIGIFAAQFISYSLGMVTSYTLNSMWTFGDKRLNPKKIAAFIAVNLVALGVSTAILYFCRSWRGIEGVWAKLISLPFSITVNFIGNRLFVFKSK